MTPKPQPWNKLYQPSPADWGIGMTICIAALAREAIVTVADSMVSTEYFSADTSAYKLKPIHADWRVMYAGNDLGRISPFYRRITQILSDEVGDKACSYVQVENALRTAWGYELRTRIESLYLARYGMNIEEFRKDGERSFGAQYQSMKYQIDEVRLGFDLLVVGFDVLGFPHIMSISDPGDISHHTLYNFWAIGSGAPAALSHFFSYGKPVFENDCESVLYKSLAAKFAAEVAPGVGKDTFVMIHRKDGSLLTTTQANEARPVWDQNGVPKMPKQCLEAAKNVIAGCNNSPTRKPPKPSNSQTTGDQP